MTAKFKRLVMASLLLIPLAGCLSTDGGEWEIAPPSAATEPQKLAAEGVGLLQDGSYELASVNFNNALKLDVSNSYLQFLNGLAYHLRALKGDASLYPLAEQGYELAIQFDQSNWMARYQMGLLQLDQRKFAKARDHLAEAAIYRNDDAGILYNLAAASYYAQDPVTAAAALKTLRKLRPNSRRGLKASSIVLAALDKPAEANAYMTRLTTLDDTSPGAGSTRRRLADWRRFHGRTRQTILAQMEDREVTREDMPSPGMSGEEEKKEDEEEEEEEEEEKEEPEPDEHQMVILDVVIIRTEEDLSTSKGVNLLNGLTLQFGQTDIANAGFSSKRVSKISSEDPGLTKTITKAISLKSIDYSLNIANSNTSRNEILARPTLVALAGEESEFFSGLNVNAAAVSGGDGQAVQVEKEIGVKLSVTPEFLEDGRIKLAIVAERIFLATPNTTSIDFTYRIDTSKTNVKANVAMNFGETLILSGMSEKETERTRDGVPLLQDLPLVQYLFSKRTTRDFQKSVLILVTPRPTNYIYRSEANKKKAGKSLSKSERVLSELQARYSDWFRPYPNWASVFHHMQANSLYREFRTGDVALEKWESQQSLGERLRQALEFIYY